MHSKQQSWNSFSRTSSPAAKATLAMVIVLALTVVSAPSAQAQTEPYEAIHAFTLGQHGATPFAGLARHKAGNLYGAAVVNGNGGLNPKGSNVTVLRNLAADTGSAMSTTSISRTNGSGPVTYGQEVDLLATVTGDGISGTPTGTVAFTVNGNSFDANCDSVPLTRVDANTANAPCHTTLLPAGNPTTITGTYSGDSTYAPSRGMGTQVVNKVGVVFSNFTSSPNPSQYRQSVTLSVRVMGAFGGVPTGSVSFFDNGTQLCSGNLDGNGNTHCSTTALSVGTHSNITATYNGDGNFNTGTSTPLNPPEVVTKADVVFSNFTSVPNPSQYLQPVQLFITVAGRYGGVPTGSVSFFDNGTQLCSGNLDGNGNTHCSTTALSVGTHSNITATYNGDGNFNTGTSTPLNPPEVVTRAATTTTVQSSVNPSDFGQPVTFTATVTGQFGGTPTGTVTFASDGGPIPQCPSPVTLVNGVATCSTSSLLPGDHTIQASYSGDQNYDPSVGTMSPPQVVNKAHTTTTVTSSQNPSSFGQPVTFTATVTGIWITPTGTVTFASDGGPIPECPNSVPLNNGVATCTTLSLPAGGHTIRANYSGDQNYDPSVGVVTQVVIEADTTTTVSSSQNPSDFGQPVTFTATVTGIWITPTGEVTFGSDGGPIPECPSPVTLVNGVATCTTSSLPAGEHTIEARYFGDNNYNASSGTLWQIVNPGPPPVQFVAVTPCRLVDTRPQYGGNGPIQGGTSQSFPIPQEGGCNIPTTAVAYSLNVSVVPSGPLGYLTIWATGGDRPVVATLNSLDGRIKADAAIVPAGADGAVSVYVTNTTNVVLDINGYFAPISGSTLAFYPLPPCRIADTRNSNYPQGLGPPYLTGRQERAFPILDATACNIPSSAAAYSLNFAVVPHGALGYMTVWPTGETRPTVSTLNDIPGTIIANAAIVPAGTGGDISVYPTNDTDLVIDINGYFAPAGAGGLSLYTAAPCRVIDTRHVGNGQPFSGNLTPPVDVVDSRCGLPAAAQAYVFNATVVPVGGLGYLTLWPDGSDRPTVSTLNALDGSITNNMAIVPSTNGKVDAYASGITQLILDISSYFAP